MDAAGGHINADQVTGLNQCQRAAQVGLGRDMQNAGAIAGAAHAGIRNSEHVFNALLDQLGRDRQHAPLGHARAALRAGVAQDHHVVGRDIQVRVVDGFFHARVIVKHQRRAGVLEEVRRAGAGLDDATIGRQVAPEHGQRPFGVDRVGQRTDHVVVVNLGAFQVLADAAAGHGHGAQIKVVAQHVHHGAHAAGEVKIFHQVLVAAGPDVGDHRHLAAGRVKVFEADGAVLAGAARHRHQMNDGVGRATHGHGHGDGVFK